MHWSAQFKSSSGKLHVVGPFHNQQSAASFIGRIKITESVYQPACLLVTDQQILERPELWVARSRSRLRRIA